MALLRKGDKVICQLPNGSSSSFTVGSSGTTLQLNMFVDSCRSQGGIIRTVRGYAAKKNVHVKSSSMDGYCEVSNSYLLGDDFSNVAGQTQGMYGSVRKPSVQATKYIPSTTTVQKPSIAPTTTTTASAPISTTTSTPQQPNVGITNTTVPLEIAPISTPLVNTSNPVLGKQKPWNKPKPTTRPVTVIQPIVATVPVVTTPVATVPVVDPFAQPATKGMEDMPLGGGIGGGGGSIDEAATETPATEDAKDKKSGTGKLLGIAALIAVTVFLGRRMLKAN